MPNRTHILLLDHDAARRATASAILGFLDESHVALGALPAAREASERLEAFGQELSCYEVRWRHWTPACRW